MSRKRLVAVCAVLFFHCGAPSTQDAGSGGGSGGGSTAGGAGGGAAGGGTAGACAPAPRFVATDLNGKAGFDPGGMSAPPAYNFATMVRSSATPGRFDVMFNEFYSDGPVTNFALPAATHQQCASCLVIQTACDGTGANCAKVYLAQSGMLSVSAATKSPDAGSYAFTLSNVTYQTWDFAADVATDGGCLTLATFTFGGAWP